MLRGFLSFVIWHYHFTFSFFARRHYALSLLVSMCTWERLISVDCFNFHRTFVVLEFLCFLWKGFDVPHSHIFHFIHIFIAPRYASTFRRTNSMKNDKCVNFFQCFRVRRALAMIFTVLWFLIHFSGPLFVVVVVHFPSLILQTNMSSKILKSDL